MGEIKGRKMKRINKRQARKIIENGGTIWVIPHKLNINSMWSIAVDINKDILNRLEVDFDTFLEFFKSYNCNYEAGYYPAYYTAD